MTSRPIPAPGRLRAIACLAVLALLSACSGSQTVKHATTTEYVARARGNYTPPGPPGDPWGPYIVEAAQRFDVPERWIREVMRVESAGKTLATSQVGAMGLMQVMPGTYEELRSRYELGEDPFEPHSNILAGTAYLREMYDIYGSPGFLAAYNAGPGRLDDYLTKNRSLPDETRRYVAKIGPNIAGIAPQRVAQAQQMAMYQLPNNIPAGPRYPRGGRSQAPVALADTRYNRPGLERGTVVASALPEPPRAPPPAPVQMAAAAPRGGFRLISPAMADTMPRTPGGPTTGGWAIQVGAYGNEGQARSAAEAAKGHAWAQLAAAKPAIGSVKQGSNTLYRARLTGLSRDAAAAACERIARGKTPCMVVSPDA
jgi:hypothetical protein